jgi:hypothetical protein
MTDKQNYYYRIYDDKEDFNFIKSSLSHDEVEKILKTYETSHQKFLNVELVSYLRQFDPQAEIIEVNEISY